MFQKYPEFKKSRAFSVAGVLAVALMLSACSSGDGGTLPGTPSASEAGMEAVRQRPGIRSQQLRGVEARCVRFGFRAAGPQRLQIGRTDPVGNRAELVGAEHEDAVEIRPRRRKYLPPPAENLSKNTSNLPGRARDQDARHC